MKLKLLLVIIIIVYFFQWQITGCNNVIKTEKGEAAVKNYFYEQIDSLIYSLDKLHNSVVAEEKINELKNGFKDCRKIYKKTEAICEYYFQGLVKRINGAPLPDIKTEDGQVWPPHGFQVIEQQLYENGLSAGRLISAEIRLLQTDLRFIKNNMEFQSILQNHIDEIIQHQFVRIAALGITGFDAAVSKLSLFEAKYSLESIERISNLFFNDISADKRKKLLLQSIGYLDTNSDFDGFNRMDFLTDYLVPLSEMYARSTSGNDIEKMMVKPFNGTLRDFLTGDGLNADYYASYADAHTAIDKVKLGRQLFFDKKLSLSGTISCGSCHKPELFFTDGKQKAENFVHGGSLARNTPGLYYAGLQSHQFYDLRSVSLEDQVDQVMKSSDEFNFSSSAIASKLQTDTTYVGLFTKAFGIKKSNIESFQVRNAIAAFIRSLNPFSSAFDEYMKGNKQALTSEQVRGFNLFTGKAKCATCHFIPLFNGNIPPWLIKSESEIIGVPSSAVWKNATVDTDSGRYNINKMKELMFSFKTPGIRNIEKTAPYMHNGIYNSLEDVVEFYHKGGGAGIGIDLPFQTLPFDSLSLNHSEKEAIISFMKALTDKKSNY